MKAKILTILFVAFSLAISADAQTGIATTNKSVANTASAIAKLTINNNEITILPGETVKCSNPKWEGRWETINDRVTGFSGYMLHLWKKNDGDGEENVYLLPPNDSAYKLFEGPTIYDFTNFNPSAKTVDLEVEGEMETLKWKEQETFPVTWLN